MLEREELTQCELLVIKVIWECEDALSIQEIAERVNRKFNRGWKIQTVSAFLGHIVHKGYLTMKRAGRRFYYYPQVTEEEYRTYEFTKSVNFWCEGRADKFLAAFAKDRSFTEEEKQHMKDIINDLD